MINSNITTNSSVNGFQTNDCFIEVNGSMFRMLTKDTYNDSKAAVIREWSTNAIDACIEAGIEPNFYAHMPTYSDPTFYVRDYGTGLSKDDLLGLYSTLGASTKRDSNKTNGTFGIGRFAGLAYSDLFTVESFYNGEHHAYSFSFVDDTIKSIHLFSTKTDEPNGLKLSVEVPPEDIIIFENKATRIYELFDTKPNTNIELKYTKDLLVPLYDNLYQYKKADYCSNYVLMSNVLYKIPRDSQINNKNFINTVIKADNGDVSFNPGRETLNLNTKTLNFLNDVYKKAEENIIETSLKTFNSFDKDYDKYQYINTIGIGLPTSIYHKLQNLIEYTSPGGVNLSLKPSYYNYAFSIKQKLSYYVNLRIPSRNGILEDILVVDMYTNFSKYIKQLDKTTTVITINKGVSLEEFRKQYKQMFDDVGITKYTLLSDVYTPETVTKKKQTEGFYVRQIYGDDITSTTNCSIDDFADIETVYYLPFRHSNLDIDNNYYKDNFNTLLKMYKRYCNNNLTIVGVQKKYLSLTKKHENMKPFIPELDNFLNTYKFPPAVSLDILSIMNNVLFISDKLPKELLDIKNLLDKYKDVRFLEFFYEPVLEDLQISFDKVTLPKSLDYYTQRYSSLAIALSSNVYFSGKELDIPKNIALLEYKLEQLENDKLHKNIS